MINVTRSIMPPLERYTQGLEKLWESRWLTNNGEYLVTLEEKLSKRFDTGCVIVSNGTLALLIAIELFDFPIGSEIITTPFTFVATVSSIIWQKYKPVFVDVNPETFNIDESKIQEKITDRTVAILGVHVFGNPCEVEEIDRIARQHNLKIIYDAAHCFDVYYKGNSLYSYGDVSIASFHATKVFHTIEGGAIFTKDQNLLSKARRLRNFGFNEKIEIVEKGINAKMNEFQALMGILNLEIVDEEIEKRKSNYELYQLLLDGKVKFQKMNEKITKYNYIYMPVLFKNSKEREEVYSELLRNGYNTRKYFSPSLDLIFSSEETPISRELSQRILHLPLYGDLEKEDIEHIAKIVRNIVR